MQAARGTAVDHDDGGPEHSRSPVLAHPPTWWVFALVAGFWYVVDQVTKQVANRHLVGREDIEVIGELLQLHLTHNPGAAFSLGPDFTVGISILAVVASLVVGWISRGVRNRVWAVALGLLLAGIAGNLTDRIFQPPAPFRGEVIDFLMLPNWPVFNIADVCINVGVGLVLLQTFRGIGVDGTRHRSATTSTDEGE